MRVTSRIGKFQDSIGSWLKGHVWSWKYARDEEWNRPKEPRNRNATRKFAGFVGYEYLN